MGNVSDGAGDGWRAEVYGDDTRVRGEKKELSRVIWDTLS